VGEGGGEEEDEEGGFVPRKVSQRILRQAQAQLAEEAESDEEIELNHGLSGKKRVRFGGGKGRSVGGSAADTFLASTKKGQGEDEEDEEDDLEIDLEFGDDSAEGGSSQFGDGGLQRGQGAGGETFVDGVPDFDIGGAEGAVLSRFMPEEANKRRTLADIIMEKLAARMPSAHGEEGGEEGNNSGQEEELALDPRAIEVYTEVGRFLSTYKVGKIPKVFKVIPSLPNWEEVLFLTNPETWTPHATYAATRIFVSNLNASKAQRFNALILLPKCRDDIYMHKRLNFHLYLSLRKAVYKPAAFYKGILLPLAAGGDCTLREALIVGSVIARSSVPQLHSAAAIIRLAGLPYSGSVSIFLRYLLNKKYSLPMPAVDATVDHLLSFKSQEGPLPVIWHQSFLALVQRYKGALTPQQIVDLTALTGEHFHHGISPEIRREFSAAAAAKTSSTSTAPAPPLKLATHSSAVIPAKASKKAGGGGSRQMMEDEY